MMIKTGNQQLAELAGSFKIPVVYDINDLESSIELDQIDVDRLVVLWTNPKSKFILNQLVKML
jgi:hypothetical protein